MRTFKIYAPNFQIYDILSLANSLGIAILNDYLLFLHPYSVCNSSLDILSFDFVQQCHWVDTVIIHILKMRPRFSKVTDLTKVTQSALSIIIPGVWVSETTDLSLKVKMYLQFSFVIKPGKSKAESIEVLEQAWPEPGWRW